MSIPTDTATPEEETQQTQVEPCGTSKDVPQPIVYPSPPPQATDDNPKPDISPAEDSLPTHATKDATHLALALMAAQPSPPLHSRPTPARWEPQRYEPETGTWVKHRVQ